MLEINDKATLSSDKIKEFFASHVLQKELEDQSGGSWIP
jgi:hypothetical protein